MHELGSKVQHIVSGAVGIVDARVEYLHAGERYRVACQVGDDSSKVPDVFWAEGAELTAVTAD